MILKGLKDNSEVIGVILFTLRIDQNIINKYNDEQVKKLMEHSIHKIHEGCSGVSQPEGHD